MASLRPTSEMLMTLSDHIETVMLRAGLLRHPTREDILAFDYLGILLIITPCVWPPRLPFDIRADQQFMPDDIWVVVPDARTKEVARNTLASSIPSFQDIPIYLKSNITVAGVSRLCLIPQPSALQPA